YGLMFKFYKNILALIVVFLQLSVPLKAELNNSINAVKKIFVEVQHSEFSNFKNEGNKSKSGRSYLPYRWGKLVFNDQFTSKLDNFEKSIL
mgnify:CR=1